MKTAMMAILGAGLLATPAMAQNAQGMLNGLLSGNQNQDRAVQEAYERGYQKGRQDEAHMRTSDRGDTRRYDNDRSSGYGNDSPAPPPGYNQSRNNYSR